MNTKMTIFWPSFLLLSGLPADVFTRPINIDRDHLEKPMWIMSKAGDHMPNDNNSAPCHDSFDDNNNKIHPFINWNGVLKMVVPIHCSSGMTGYTSEVIPDVYNWDTLPCFRNNRISSGCEYCDDAEGNDGNRFGKTTLTAMCLLAILLVACIIVCSCLTCRHKPGCHNLKDDEDDEDDNDDDDDDDDELCKTTSSGDSTDGRYKNNADRVALTVRSSASSTDAAVCAFVKFQRYVKGTRYCRRRRLTRT